jgi:hypothetical protein
MEDRILSGAAFVVLGVVFGGYGFWSLLAAYRTGDRSAWTEKAIQGCAGVMLGAVFCDLVARLLG